MNKILTLLIALVVIYQSFSPLVKILTKKRISRKEYTLTFSKQFNHLFSATLLLVIPLLAVSNYYQFYPQLPFSVKIGLAGLAILCGIGAWISFYLYAHYVKKTSYQSLIYDPKQFTIELLTYNSRQLIRLTHVRGVEWYSIKNFLKIMPWSNFEYLVLELDNGSRAIITSLIIAPAQLHAVVSRFEVIHHKMVIPTIR
jgi:hypothetical protein